MADVLVIGAGPVGATFALLAARQGLSVRLLEAREGPSRETRTLALSHGSREILSRAGAWPEALAATEIHTIHSSQKGGFGRVRLSRDDANVPALGYVTSYANLQAALDTGLETAKMAVTRGAVVSAIENGDSGASVTYAQGGTEHVVKADAVVLADGGANLAKVPEIRVEEKDYRQTAMLGHILADTPHGHIAYERFTPEGPAALLPNDERGGDSGHFSMVWVSSPERIAELMALDEAACCAAFQTHFGRRAGKFLSLTQRRHFPLKLRTVNSPVAKRVAVIGNAAQALHPIAGQGFNLGLRDAYDLSALLSPSVSAGLPRYAKIRARDVDRTVGFTDFLLSAFDNDHALLRMPRGLALAAIDALPLARRLLARRMLFGVTR
jgi:2-octaprenyl-6-methoxyphenol hydroxylase